MRGKWSDYGGQVERNLTSGFLTSLKSSSVPKEKGRPFWKTRAKRLIFYINCCVPKNKGVKPGKSETGAPEGKKRARVIANEENEEADALTD